MNEATSMLDAALAYAECGHAVFPVNGKAPLTEHGFKDATTDQETIRRWWTDYPSAGIGSPVPPGEIVLDVDPRNGGDATFDQLLSKCGPLPATVTKLTGGHGRHLNFRLPGSFNGSVVRSSLGPGLDVKVGGKGYTILPPSPHPSGTPYAWAPFADLEKQVVALLPRPWLEEVRDEANAGKRFAVPIPEQIPEGARNQTLASLAGSMRRRGASEEAILAAIRAENENRCKPQLADDEVRKIAASIANYSPAERVSFAADPAAVDASDTISPQMRFTDLGNARRFVRRHGHSVRYCYPWNSWLWYDGRRWIKDDSGEIERRAKEAIEAMHAEATGLTGDERARLLKHALKSESAGRVRSMIELARSELGMAVAVEQLDNDPWLFNAKNGTIDLRAGKLRQHSPDDLITRMSPVDYEPEATCPNFEAFLVRIMDRNLRLIAYLQRVVGYALTGRTSEHAFLIPYGAGANGKSTLTRSIEATMADYALSTPPETLMVKYGEGGASEDVARLCGARFVSAIETEAGRKLAEAKIKLLTGGDKVTARFLWGHFFDFYPQFKIWFATNHKPVIRGQEEAIWRRIHLIPFNVTIPKAERIPDYFEKVLARELPGILAWAVIGCLNWQTDGLTPPDEVQKATAEYREEMDVVAAFIADRCSVGNQASARAGALYKAFKDWCEEQGEKPMSGSLFGRHLEDRGFPKRKDYKGVARLGLELLDRSGGQP